MTRSLALLATELRLLVRYRILLAAAAAAAGYCAVFAFAGAYVTPAMTAFLIYTDPAVLGLAFAGLLTMLECEQGVARQLAAAPVSALTRLVWRVVSLSIPALGASILFALLFAGISHWGGFLLATASTSVTYCAIGVVIALHVRRVTAFIALSGVVVAPLSASALLAFTAPPFAASWPFASQLAVMSAALSPGAAIPASSLAVCIGAAGFALLAAARVAARRGPA